MDVLTFKVLFPVAGLRTDDRKTPSLARTAKIDVFGSGATTVLSCAGTLVYALGALQHHGPEPSLVVPIHIQAMRGTTVFRETGIPTADPIPLLYTFGIFTAPG